MGLAVGGMTILGWFLVTTEITGDPAAFGERFIPRISMVVLIEIFAYFFLRLYSASLTETKYYQNELTNIDAQYLALQSATNIADAKLVGEVISLLAKTERNFVLQKGQSTVDVERSRLSTEQRNTLSQALAKLLEK